MVLSEPIEKHTIGVILLFDCDEPFSDCLCDDFKELYDLAKPNSSLDLENVHYNIVVAIRGELDTGTKFIYNQARRKLTEFLDAQQLEHSVNTVPWELVLALQQQEEFLKRENTSPNPGESQENSNGDAKTKGEEG